MSAFRLGRSSVRFLHNYQAARVSYRGTAPFSVTQIGSQQAQWLRAAYVSARGYADSPVARPKQHTGRAPARKPRAKAATTTKKTTTAKKTSAPKKTKQKAAKKPAKKPKKELTPEQIERKEKRVQAVKIRDLKAQSLKKEEPSGKLDTAWRVYIAEQQKKAGAEAGKTLQERVPFVRQIAAQYKSFDPSELEHYNHVANSNKAAFQAEHRQWLTSLNPIAVKEANTARQRLTKLGIKGYTSPIKDTRKPKAPRSAYIHFFVERHASGDFKGIAPTEAVKLVAQEWKDLSAGERQKYDQQQAQDKQRYVKEYKEAYDKEPEVVRRSSRSSS